MMSKGNVIVRKTHSGNQRPPVHDDAYGDHLFDDDHKYSELSISPADGLGCGSDIREPYRHSGVSTRHTKRVHIEGHSDNQTREICVTLDSLDATERWTEAERGDISEDGRVGRSDRSPRSSLGSFGYLTHASDTESCEGVQMDRHQYAFGCDSWRDVAGACVACLAVSIIGLSVIITVVNYLWFLFLDI
jgi:hypothetical protein